MPATLPRLPLLGLLAGLALAHGASAAAQRWACTVAPTSSFQQTTQIQLPLAGTWIGNYDATTNPTGTQTRPGFFGGSGNVAIPFSATVKPTAEIPATNPTGGFELSLDASTGVVQVFGYSVNSLGAQQGTVTTRMAVTYQTFRSFAPNSTFIGLTNVEIPFDSGALTRADALQSGPAIGAGTLNPDGTWSFVVSVPVNVTVEGTALAAPFASTTPALVAMTGTIAITKTGITVTSQGSVNESVPVPAPPPLVNQPFDLPTVLPAGSVARLLMNGTFSDGTTTTTASSTIVALGTPVARFGDLNGDGVVNGADLGLLLGAWGSTGPGDLNGDGTVSGADLGLLLGAWG
jgi:hypothetical protein